MSMGGGRVDGEGENLITPPIHLQTWVEIRLHPHPSPQSNGGQSNTNRLEAVGSIPLHP